jgi:excisionase family DNA binding protein
MQGDLATWGHDWVTVKEAAALARVSRQTVHLWIAHGRVQAVQTDDGDLRLDTEEFDRFLTMRRAASVAGVRFDTLRHWVDDAAGVWAAAPLLGAAMTMS